MLESVTAKKYAGCRRDPVFSVLRRGKRLRVDYGVLLEDSDLTYPSFSANA